MGLSGPNSLFGYEAVGPSFVAASLLGDELARRSPEEIACALAMIEERLRSRGIDMQEQFRPLLEALVPELARIRRFLDSLEGAGIGSDGSIGGLYRRLEGCPDPAERSRLVMELRRVQTIEAESLSRTFNSRMPLDREQFDETIQHARELLRDEPDPPALDEPG